MVPLGEVCFSAFYRRGGDRGVGRGGERARAELLHFAQDGSAKNASFFDLAMAR